jgi:hypothetical protein
VHHCVGWSQAQREVNLCNRFATLALSGQGERKLAKSDDISWLKLEDISCDDLNLGRSIQLGPLQK